MSNNGWTVDDDDRQEQSIWENRTISQILLPVLCAFFVVTVIVVIACCLTQKKSKSSERGRKKSCHTIETSHETSDHGIYDVIDDVNVSKPSRNQNKLSFSCLVASQNDTLHHPKTSNIFTTNTPAIPYRQDHRFVVTPSTVTSSNASAPEQASHVNTRVTNVPVQKDVRFSYTQTDNEDEEGIYETLDRHWTFEKAQGYQIRNDPTPRPSFFLGDGAEAMTISSGQSNQSRLSWQSKITAQNSHFQRTTDDTKFQHGPTLKWISSPLCTGLQSSDCSNNSGKIVCQLTMFHVPGDESFPSKSEMGLYNIHLEENSDISLPATVLPSLLQSKNLKIIPVENVTEKSPSECPFSIILKPVQSDTNTSLNKLHSCPTKLHEQGTLNSDENRKLYDKRKFQRSNSKRFPVLLVKKSDSFREASSELNAAKEHYLSRRRRSESCKLGTRKTSLHRSNTQPRVLSNTEVTRIIAKLGPLPPLPVQPRPSSETEGAKHIAEEPNVSVDPENRPYPMDIVNVISEVSEGESSSISSGAETDPHAVGLASSQRSPLEIRMAGKRGSLTSEICHQPMSSHVGSCNRLHDLAHDAISLTNETSMAQLKSHGLGCGRNFIESENSIAIDIEGIGEVGDMSYTGHSDKDSNHYFILEPQIPEEGSTESNCYSETDDE